MVTSHWSSKRFPESETTWKVGIAPKGQPQTAMLAANIRDYAPNLSIASFKIPR
jgi:hypothetical protein